MTRTTVLLAASLLAACTAKNPDQGRPASDARPAEAPPAAQEPAKQAPTDPAPVDPAPAGSSTAAPTELAQADPAPVDPAPAGSTTAAPTELAQAGSTGDPQPEPTGPAPLVAAAIAPIDHAPTWRDVTTLPRDTAPTGFFYFATGILAGKAPNFYSTDASGALAPVAIDPPPGPVSGHWPGEAWSFQTQELGDRAVTTRGRLHRLRGGNRWVPQDLLGEQWHYSEDYGALRKSWKIGYLVEVKNSLIRVASNGLEDPPAMFYRGDLMDIVESKAGDLFTLSQDGGYFVQIFCPAQACVDANATPLPAGAWEWVHTIPRQKHSVSITLREPATDRQLHLLHYETGGWKLEALPDGHRLAGLWPTADGGLWAQTEGALLHRDPAGAWRKVALPAGVQPTGPVFAAMTGDMSELWLIGTRGDAQVVLATRARTQAPG